MAAVPPGAALLAPGTVSSVAPVASGYERSLRPCLGPRRACPRTGSCTPAWPSPSSSASATSPTSPRACPCRRRTSTCSRRSRRAISRLRPTGSASAAGGERRRWPGFGRRAAAGGGPRPGRRGAAGARGRLLPDRPGDRRPPGGRAAPRPLCLAESSSSGSKRSGSSNGPITARFRRSARTMSWATRCTSSTRDRVEPASTSSGSRALALEHLTPAARSRSCPSDPRARARGAPSRSSAPSPARRRDTGSAAMRPNSRDDRRDRLVDPLDVDAALGEERARVRVALVVAVDVVREPAPLAHLAEEARGHSAAEHGCEERSARSGRDGRSGSCGRRCGRAPGRRSSCAP